MKYILPLLLIYLLLVGLGQQGPNKYIIYTKNKAINASYTDTRDPWDGDVKYVDMHNNHYWIPINSIDSIVVLEENRWYAGPQSDSIKYIHHEKH